MTRHGGNTPVAPRGTLRAAPSRSLIVGILAAPFSPRRYTFPVTDPARQPSPYEAEQRRRALFLRAIRVGFLVLFLAVTFLSIFVVTEKSVASEIQRAIAWQGTLIVAALMAAAVLAVDYFTPRKRVSTLFAVFVGLLAALLATVALGFIIDVIVKSYDIKAADTLVATIKVLLGISLSYLGVTTVLQTQDDFRLVIPYVEFSKQMRGVRPLVLDTSALIDGRIADIAPTNFLLAPIVIPQFVIDELQTLSDSADSIRRTKGRRGLDIVSRLQRQPRLDVSIDESRPTGKAVDQMLVEYARSHSAIIVTTDTGLARVATIQNITLLNINDLANALKPALVPGERLTVKLIKQGGQAGQAVGYLPDGTMIVAENGFHAIGQTVDMTVTSALQTSAGRLIFARLDHSATTPIPPAANQPAGPAPQQPDAQTNPPSEPPSDMDPEAPEAPYQDQPNTDPTNPTSGPANGPSNGPGPARSPRSTRQGTPRNPRR